MSAHLLRFPFVAALATGSLLWCAGCTSTGPANTRKAEAPLVVPVAAVTRDDLGRGMELAAEFRPYQEVDVHAKVAGYLRTITVDVGDRVRAGQLLATLEVPEMSQDLVQASAAEKRTELDVARSRSEVNRAQATVRMREISYNRLATVAKARPRMIAQQEIDDAEGRLREAEAQLATAQAALAATEQSVLVSGAGRERVSTMLQYLRIIAPFSGIITKRYASQGAMIQAGTASQTQAMPVVRLSQIDRLRLVLPAPESIVSRVKVGSPVSVRVETLQRVFPGKVSRLTHSLDTATRTMETEVDVPNANGTLMPGMYAYANINLESRESVLTVPVQALSRTGASRGAASDVLVVDANNTVQTRAVQVGMESPDRAEVLSGLQEGDRVVLGNRTRLKPGQRVTPKMMPTVAMNLP